jgi:hypothetical protein
MNNPVDPRKIPQFIERLAKAGYLLGVECSKREIRITYNRSASKYMTIPFGQTRQYNFNVIVVFKPCYPVFLVNLPLNIGKILQYWDKIVVFFLWSPLSFSESQPLTSCKSSLMRIFIGSLNTHQFPTEKGGKIC